MLIELTLSLQVPHHFTNTREAAQIECAKLLIDQAAGANLDDLQSVPE
jgi:hypothetical protein